MDLLEVQCSEHPYEHMSEDDRVYRALATMNAPKEYKCKGPVEDRGVSTTAFTLRECKCRGSKIIS